MILIVKINPHWGEVFEGFLPSKKIGNTAGALYTSIGIVGATVMPHALFLGSSLATQNRVGQELLDLNLRDENKESEDGMSAGSQQTSSEPTGPPDHPRRRVRGWLSALISVERVEEMSELDTININRLRFIKAHLKNAIVDIGMPLNLVRIPP